MAVNHQHFLSTCYPGLYGITSEQMVLDDTLLVECVEQALEGGLKLLQYRNKTPSDPLHRQRQARKLVKLCDDYDVPLIINDDVFLATQVNAHGVHLGNEDLSVEKARSVLGDSAIIGATCKHSLSAARLAEKNGASYIAFGAFYPSQTKPEASLAPLSILTDAKKHCHLPVVAIGGITTENCNPILEKGADMLAVVHSLFGAEDIKKQTRVFNRKILESKMVTGYTKI